MAHKLIEEAIKRGFTFGRYHKHDTSQLSFVVEPKMSFDKDGNFTGAINDGYCGNIYCPKKGWSTIRTEYDYEK